MDRFFRWYKYLTLLLIVISLVVLLFNSISFMNNFVLLTFGGTAFLHALVIKNLYRNDQFRFLAKKIFLVFLSFPLIIHLVALFNSAVFANSYPLYFGGLFLQFWFLTIEKNNLMDFGKNINRKRLFFLLFSISYILLILLILISPLDNVFYEIGNYAFLPIILFGSWLILKN